MRALVAVAVLVALAAASFPAAAQDPQPTGTGTTIAVLDSGIDATHPELSGRVTRESFAEPTPPIGLPAPIDLPLPDDPDGQGTAVASLAAGRTLGVAPGADLLDLQVSAKYTGQAAVDPATEAAAIEALDALLREPGRAQVVLLSFAQAGVSEAGGRTLAQQARGLWDAGVLVVVPTAPEANPLSAAAHVLTVAGRESCPAAGTDAVKPDLVAPSQQLEAADADDPTDPQQGSTTTVSGTAYAAAKVAGAAALLRQVEPDLPVDALASFLRDSAQGEGTPGVDRCGFGELDAATAVAWARDWRDPLADEGTRDVPGPTLFLLGAALAVAAWAGRRHG